MSRCPESGSVPLLPFYAWKEELLLIKRVRLRPAGTLDRPICLVSENINALFVVGPILCAWGLWVRDWGDVTLPCGGAVSAVADKPVLTGKSVCSAAFVGVFAYF